METSILNSVKKNLGLAPDYTVYDGEVLTYINTAFFALKQLGFGPIGSFTVLDEDLNWSDFSDDEVALDGIKTYVTLQTRLLFDPPATSFAIVAMEKQLAELVFRLNVQREETAWVDPTPVVIVDE